MQAAGSAPARLHSPPPSSGAPPHGAALLETAVEHLMITTDFHSALAFSERGLQSLKNPDQREESCRRNGEVKAALCTVGIQALAELNRWSDVLPWLLEHYGEPGQIPAKIMQMCILLYTKVAEQAAVREAVRAWLDCSANVGVSGYSSVAELYILHVLLPLGHSTEIRRLLEDEAGQVAFGEEQRQTALALLEQPDPAAEPLPEPKPDRAEPRQAPVTSGSLMRKFTAIRRLLFRSLSVVQTGVWSRLLCRTALLLLLLYLLLLRMDAASPSALAWILRLHALMQQMWKAMFGPYYTAFA